VQSLKRQNPKLGTWSCMNYDGGKQSIMGPSPSPWLLSRYSKSRGSRFVASVVWFSSQILNGGFAWAPLSQWLLGSVLGLRTQVIIHR
jgi:hypothetical protein